jgi:hypothetical protein
VTFASSARNVRPDNASELAAPTNDEGWNTVLAAWLDTSAAGAPMIYSVGCDAERKSATPQVNPNLVTENFQVMVCHRLVSAALQRSQTK